MKIRARVPRVTIAGYVVIDQIIDRRDQTRPRLSLGGPASYSSLALASLGYKSAVITKIGDDFPSSYARLLREEGGIDVESYVKSGARTTTFRIERYRNPRRLWLLRKCEDLYLSDFAEAPRSSSLVVNTVAGEVSPDLFSRISRNYAHVFLDSQGFVRAFSKTGEVGMRNGLDLSTLDGVEFLKGDAEELVAWTGGRDMQAAIRKLSKYVRYIILTGGPGQVRIYDGQRLALRVRPPVVSVNDTTGAGDIFLAVFAGTYSEEGNVEKSLARASCAASIALEAKGIKKAILSKDQVVKSVGGARVVRY